MRLGRITPSLIAVTALFAIAAGSAQAAPEWRINEAAFVGTAGISFETHKHEGTPVPLVFHSEILATKITVTATGVSCVACTITGGGVKSGGRLKLTGLTVDLNNVAEPNCGIGAANEIETVLLKGEIIMDPTVAGSTAVFEKLEPAAGAFLFKLKPTGAQCPLNGEEPEVKGSLCGESVKTFVPNVFAPRKTSETGKKIGEAGNEEDVEQTLLFGAAQQTTGGCELKLGKKEAQFTGAIDSALTGGSLGKSFGVVD
jgi:hypothetical protein